MKLVHTIIRIGLGLMLLVFGLNKFFWFMPDFEFGDNVGAAHLFQAFTDSGYMWPLVGGLEVIVGLLFITKKIFPVALLALIPISVNIVLFHAVLDPPNIVPALLVAVLNGYFIYRNWNNYRHLFS
ncbi:DoxX family protein [Dokdonia sp. Dokd-P16]|uniref:DoxX family membrane protein n=1 Tax=Dokdonia sp. Dokd-P16 TaxID=2173169 RepID=UPI000D547521|nr:DoxX family membrane protein [Dokdonia sp. Dokd-P16]AWH73609.1 DoxX family protein [Dokdonia sp. Dokd-P16]